MIDIVIAHYNENLGWVNTLPVESRVFLYTKGNTPIPDAVHLPNIGREAHTYWHHINTIADKAEYTVFLQGNPFDHIDSLNLTPEGLIKWLVRPGWIIQDTGTAQHHWKRLPIHDVCRDLLGFTLQTYEFAAGCQSIVHSSLLRKTALTERCLQLSMDNEDFPWINERLWKTLVTNNSSI